MKSNKEVRILFLLLSFSLAISCEKQEPLEDQNIIDDELSKFMADYNLTLRDEAKNDLDVIKFSSVADASLFLDNVETKTGFDKLFIQSILGKNIQEEDWKELIFQSDRRKSLEDNLLLQKSNFPIDSPLFPDSGDGSFDQSYLPYNSIQVGLAWDSNNNLTNVNSQLNGLTLGHEWEQVSWSQRGYADGVYYFEITYTETYGIQVGGIDMTISETRTVRGGYDSNTGFGYLLDN
ncbi:hypothetical protein [uncultured Aquimarina sp.]|uniref:hypothetical protein n=1 Tax=uncultured Aquimarina sp. TaxID=575652 RepID=UPI00262A197C|nr:hypothetical protein [uncultured Aquimarina sp.]